MKDRAFISGTVSNALEVGQLPWIIHQPVTPLPPQLEGWDTVWRAYLQRYLMEAKFISPTAIRALCFTSCLVKAGGVFFKQRHSQRDVEQFQSDPDRFLHSFLFICQCLMVWILFPDSLDTYFEIECRKCFWRKFLNICHFFLIFPPPINNDSTWLPIKPQNCFYISVCVGIKWKR